MGIDTSLFAFLSASLCFFSLFAIASPCFELPCWVHSRPSCGIFVFREVTDPAAIATFFAGAFVVLAGAALLAVFGPQ